MKTTLTVTDHSQRKKCLDLQIHGRESHDFPFLVALVCKKFGSVLEKKNNYMIQMDEIWMDIRIGSKKVCVHYDGGFGTSVYAPDESSNETIKAISEYLNNLKFAYIRSIWWSLTGLGDLSNWKT